MREISETLELQVLKQAMEIIRQRRGNECHNDVVCGKVCPYNCYDIDRNSSDESSAFRSELPSKPGLRPVHARTQGKDKMQSSSHKVRAPSSASSLVPRW